MIYDTLPLKAGSPGQQEHLPGFQGTISYLPGMPKEDGCDTTFIESEGFVLVEMQPDDRIVIDFPYEYVLLYVFSGHCRLETARKEYRIHHKDGCFASYPELRGIRTEHGPCTLSLFFLNGKLTEDLYHIYRENSFVFKSYLFPDFEQRQYLILKDYYIEGTQHIFEFSCHMNHLLVKLIQNMTPQKHLDEDGRSQLMMRVITYMEENLQEDLTIEQTATYFNLSESHFRRIFTEKMQMPPKEYITELRIKRARHLLQTTDRPLAEICGDCGFHNSNHFIQAFKKATGITPKQYRISHRLGPIQGGHS